MKYSDYVKKILMATIDQLSFDPSKYAVNPGKDFSRNRKMGFKDYILMFLIMEGDCL